MSVQVCSVPGQTEGRRKAFLEWANIYLTSKIISCMWVNVNFYKSVYHAIPTLPLGIGNTLGVQVYSSSWSN